MPLCIWENMPSTVRLWLVDGSTVGRLAARLGWLAGPGPGPGLRCSVGSARGGDCEAEAVVQLDCGAEPAEPPRSSAKTSPDTPAEASPKVGGASAVFARGLLPKLL